MENPTSLASIQQEFKNEALQGLHVNSVLIMDPRGAVVFFKAFDSSLKLEREFSELKELLAADAWVKHVGSSSAPASGVLALFGRPTLIAACPILTSERKGPSRGVLVMTRDLDGQFVENLAAETRSSTILALVSDPELPPESQRAISALRSDTSGISVQVRNSQIVGGYKLLYDIRGNPALVLQVELPRDLFQQGLTSIHYFTGAIVFSNLVFGAVTLGLLRKKVLSRLIHLNTEINRIGQERDLNSRVEAVGSDEVAKLGGAINTMLEALQKGDLQFRQIADNVRQVLWVKDETTKQITYVSPPWEHASDLTREDLFSNSPGWHETIHPEDSRIVDEMLRRQGQGQKGETEFRVVHKGGTVCWVRCRYFPVFKAPGQLKETVGVAEDITEHKNMGDVLLRSQVDLWNMMVTATEDGGI
jgi:PAS domain S-box-containing protein